MSTTLRVLTRIVWRPAGLLAALAVFCSLCSSLLAADVLLPIEARQVRVGGEIGRRISVTVHNNLMVLDLDKDFLAPFEQRQRKSGYIGLGKTIDSAVRFAAHTQDPQVIERKRQLVAKTIRLQEDDGYLGILAPGSRITQLWDIHEMSYIIFGLLSDYQYFGEKPSLVAAQKMADYILAHWSKLPADWGTRTGVVSWVAVTGLERAMLRLSRLTQDQRYCEFCLQQRALGNWDQALVIGRRPLIEGHIYAYLCRSLAQLELYRLQPKEQLLRPAQRALDFLTHGDGAAITGGCGQYEIWTDDQDGRGALAETCATAYQLRVYDSLLRLTGKALYGDLMERTIYNTLFAAQSPDGRRIRYYSPMEGERQYHPGDTYCCPCNYRRFIARLPEMIYYRAQEGIAVNLYTPSQATIDLDKDVKLTIKQDTEYPHSGHVALHVEPSQPVRFPLRLRIPAWCDRPQVFVNDQAVTSPSLRGQLLALERQWQAGDCVRLQLPMKWRLVRGRKRQAGRVAVMRGPLVFTLNPSSQEKLASWDGADLGRITIDPESLADPIPDDSVHPGGIACRVQAWKPSYATKRPGDLQLTLTEFPDPGGRAVYFRLQDLSVAVDDELFGSRSP